MDKEQFKDELSAVATGPVTENGENTKKPSVRRPRSATMLKLQWLAERVRRCDAIKRSIAEGNYKVESREVAKAILNIRFPNYGEN